MKTFLARLVNVVYIDSGFWGDECKRSEVDIGKAIVVAKDAERAEQMLYQDRSLLFDDIYLTEIPGIMRIRDNG